MSVPSLALLNCCCVGPCLPASGTVHYTVKIWRLRVSNKATSCPWGAPVKCYQSSCFTVNVSHLCLHAIQQNTVSRAFSLISFPPSEMCLSSDLCVILHLPSAQIFGVLKQNVLYCCLLSFLFITTKKENRPFALFDEGRLYFVLMS